MTDTPNTPATTGPWEDGPLPPNVLVGPNTIITGQHAFRKFFATRDRALTIGHHGSLCGVHLAVGKNGTVSIGDWCCLSGAILLCELEVRIGNYVAMAINATIADTDFHPIDPALRMLDAVACSPLGGNRDRPPVVAKPVIIEDDVWIGANALILKGVRIGAGSVVEPGAVVTRDVPPRSRVLGNPAKVVADIPEAP
jgi:acetyltransferase-like isoleucine patch superfamily enzyme